MPTLICDLRPAAAESALLIEEFRGLRLAGEPLILHWPAAPLELFGAEFVPAADAATLDAALDDEHIAVLRGCPDAALPPWLPLDDCHRVLLLTDAPDQPRLPMPEAALLAALFAGGCEAVELLPPGAATELAQSWHSGRRVGLRIAATRLLE